MPTYEIRTDMYQTTIEADSFSDSFDDTIRFFKEESTELLAVVGKKGLHWIKRLPDPEPVAPQAYCGEDFETLGGDFLQCNRKPDHLGEHDFISDPADE